MKKILVIDDAEFILESASTLLEFEGYEVYTSSDGEEGIKLAGEIKPDLILCDISMPKMDGYTVLEGIRKNEKLSTSPFIFLTAFSEKVNMRKGMEKGADDYIVKPYTRDELIAAIDAQWKKNSLIDRQVQKKVDQVGKNVTYALPHEFRTSLNEIIGSARYLNSSSEDIQQEEIKEISQDIVISANRLLKITENFLIYVSVESFSIDPQKKKQLRNFVTEEPIAILYDLASSVASRSERFEDLEVVINEDLDQVPIEIASESFNKVAEEIIENAFKFSEAGTKVRITYKLKNDFLYISVEDSGRGMKSNQIESIGALAQFERKMYEQQGVGMGLIIAKRLVEVHDGKIKIESQVEKGTTVTISFPIHND